MIWLQAFLAVAEQESFSAAADELFVSQSNLSKYIKLLEEELSVTLFDRSTRAVRITDAGRDIVPHVRDILRGYEAMQGALERHRSPAVETIRVVCVPILHLYQLSDFFIEFRNRHPNSKLEIYETDMPEVVKALDDPASSFCILRTSFIKHLCKDANYSVFPFIEDELVLICNREHPLAQAERVSISDCLHEHLAVMSLGFNEYQKTLGNYGINPALLQPMLKCGSVGTMEKYLSENAAVSFIASGIARQI